MRAVFEIINLSVVFIFESTGGAYMLLTSAKTLEALGLRRMNQSVEHGSNDSIIGMIKIVDYLLKVEEI